MCVCVCLTFEKKIDMVLDERFPFHLDNVFWCDLKTIHKKNVKKSLFHLQSINKNVLPSGTTTNI